MEFLFLLTLCYFFNFLVFAGTCPIADDVQRLHDKISKDKQRENIVQFLKDPTIWEKYLSKAFDLDRAGLKATYLAVAKSFDGISSPENKRNVNTNLNIFEEKNDAATEYCQPLAVDGKDSVDKENFSVEIYVKHLVEVLEAYNDIMEDPEPKNRFKHKNLTAWQLGDLVDNISLALKELNADKWDKEFYDKLVKAVEKSKVSEKFEGVKEYDAKGGNGKDNNGKGEDDKDNNGKGEDDKGNNGKRKDDKGNNGKWGDRKKYLPHILLSVLVTITIIGIVIFFIVKSKKHVNT